MGLEPIDVVSNRLTGQNASLGPAVEWVRDGGLLAFPTETVWGLGADARSNDAVSKLQQWKGRDRTAPISILVSGFDALEPNGFRTDAAVRALTRAFWPGPLTLVIRCDSTFADGIARADGAVGVRCSPHPVAAALCARVETDRVGPLTATSLNRSGDAAVRTREEAARMADGSGGAIRLIAAEGSAIDQRDCAAESDAAESTVLDMTETEPRVLRSGALSMRDFERVLQENSNR